MRWLLLVLTLGGAAAAGYLETQGRNSYSAYSDAQLSELEQELGQQMKKKGREADRIFTEQLLPQERERRGQARLALNVAGGLGLATVAAFLASDDASYLTGQVIYPDGGRLALNYTMPVGE